MRAKHFLFVSLLIGLISASHGYCIKEASERYGVNANLLQAIAMTESSMRPNIESHTQDIGLMGINRSWLPKLKKEFGLTEKDVWDPCMNVHIGAWILAHNFNRYGKNWQAIGAYNAACTKRKGHDCVNTRNRYSNKVWKNWQKLSPQF